MKSIASFAVAVLLYCISLSAVAQSTLKDVPLVSFNVLVISGNINVILLQSDSNFMTIEGKEHAILRLRVKQSDGTLTLSVGCASAPEEKVYAYIPVRLLENIRLLHGACVLCADELNGSILNVSLKDQSKLELKTKAYRVNAYCEALSTFTLAGPYRSVTDRNDNALRDIFIRTESDNAPFCNDTGAATR